MLFMIMLLEEIKNLKIMVMVIWFICIAKTHSILSDDPTLGLVM